MDKDRRLFIFKQINKGLCVPHWPVQYLPASPPGGAVSHRATLDTTLMLLALDGYVSETPAEFQITYFFFLLLERTADALIKYVLLHAVCIQLGHTTSS